MERSAPGYGDPGPDEGAAPRRSRREMLTGGMAGAFGAIALESLVNPPEASAATAADVSTVTAGDASIVVKGTTANPTIETGTLDKISTLHPAAAAVSFNNHRGIKVAHGKYSNDVAAFGQLPSSKAPLPVTSGGTGQTTEQAAINALTGSQSAGTFLRSDGTDATLSAIKAGDLPQVTEYAPSGLPGATAPARFVGGTTSGAPVTGTFAAGDFVIDQTGAVWVCTAAGSPGTWASVGGSTGVGGGGANYGGMFGDGSDGAAVLDGSAVPPWASLSGSVYTMTFDCFCTNLTINSGITLLSYARRILCFGTLTNNGTISNDGTDASGSTGGQVGPYSSLSCGGIGGNGATGTGGFGVEYGAAAGGAGGTGGNGSAGDGGVGGATPAERRRLRFPTSLISGAIYNTDLTKLCLGSGSGGGGGGGDGTNAGGGGGEGGGMIAIWAQSVVNNGTLSAVGGSGDNGTGGDSGGGGGGGGGVIVAYTLSPWTAGTTAINGGPPGTGTGAGTNGDTGADGVAMNVIVR
jgi:hypothetical protein